MIRHGHGTAAKRLTPRAGAIQRGAVDHALRLGHPYYGGEHVLLALVAADHPAAAVTGCSSLLGPASSSPCAARARRNSRGTTLR
jgi:hypothetical protein